MTLMRKRLNELQADVLEHLSGSAGRLGLALRGRALRLRQDGFNTAHQPSQSLGPVFPRGDENLAEQVQDQDLVNGRASLENSDIGLVHLLASRIEQDAQASMRPRDKASARDPLPAIWPTFHLKLTDPAGVRQPLIWPDLGLNWRGA